MSELGRVRSLSGPESPKPHIEKHGRLGDATLPALRARDKRQAMELRIVANHIINRKIVAQSTLYPHRHDASGVRAFDCRKDHREAVDIIGTSRLGRNSFGNLTQEL